MITQKVKIHINQDGLGVVEIDGKIVNGVVGFEVHGRPEELAKVKLEILTAELDLLVENGNAIAVHVGNPWEVVAA